MCKALSNANATEGFNFWYSVVRSTSSRPALMSSTLNLQTQCSRLSSSSYFPSPSAPHLPTSQFFFIPKQIQNRSKTSNISFYFFTPRISLQDNRNISCQAASTLLGDEEEGKYRIEEARETIREYLEEVGASSDDASQISLSCPSYLNSLIDAVNDLDDWNLWTSADSSQENAGNVIEFKKKVYQMAKQKGDKGILPFLESLGLSLSTATHLARYLSASHALPDIILKVKYVKEILFSGSDDHGLIGKNALRMMAQLSISADEDLQQTLAFFEKIQARRGGLNLLGSEISCFRYLIESFPRLLLLPLESHVKPLMKFLEDIGVPKGYIRNTFLLFPPILSYDIDKDIKPRLRSLAKVGAKDQDLGKMLVKYPWILSTGVLENFEKLLDFFDGEKVPKICSSHAIKNWPHILGCSVNKLKLMVQQFDEMGISNKKLGQVIARSPQLLLRKPQEIVQVISFFKDSGLDEEAIARTLGRCPEIFAASVDKTLKKKLEFLFSVGISKTYLPRVIRKYPELFVCDVDRALLPRMRYLKKIGLSKKDIVSMVSRFSPLLGYSVKEVLQPKLEFLVNTMGFPLSEVVDYPRYFSYSLEKKIKPRYWVLRGRNIEFNLKDMLSKNDEEFATEYLSAGEMLIPPS